MTPPSVLGGVRLALDRSAALLREVSGFGVRVAEAVERVGRGPSAGPATTEPGVAGGPPADWLAKVRAGAPHLLEPSPPAQFALPPLAGRSDAARWHAEPTDQRPRVRAEAMPAAPGQRRPVRPDSSGTLPAIHGRHRSGAAAEPGASAVLGMGARRSAGHPAPPASIRQASLPPVAPASATGHAPVQHPSESSGLSPRPDGPRRAPIGPRLLPLGRANETPELSARQRSEGDGSPSAGIPPSPRPAGPMMRLVPVAVRDQHAAGARAIATPVRPADPERRPGPLSSPVLGGSPPGPPQRPTHGAIDAPTASIAPTADARRATRSLIQARPRESTSEQPREGPMTTADRWAALEPQTDRTEIASSPRWPSLSSAAAYAALDPLEEQAAHQRTVDRARFLHAEQERWS